MIDYSDIFQVKDQLQKAQDNESDQRQKVREAHAFIDQKDGQWEPEIIRRMEGRPRYTFDKCTPVVDGIAGEIDGADFGIQVKPAGGDATKEIARTYEGLIRNIENISNAEYVYASAGRECVAAGLAGWEVVVDYVDGDSFEQDFIIKWITDYENRVWFDQGALQQDMSDARFVFILDKITTDEYESRFPNGSRQSVDDDRSWDYYEHKPEYVTVGRFIYKKPYIKQLVQMTDGSVYERDEKFEQVVDELAEQGITVKQERKKESFKVYSRMFDGGGFLGDSEEETVFRGLPVIPVYANFKVREGKIIYHGAIEKLMDPQRVYNYGRSRETGDVALSPPDIFWATNEQLKGAKLDAALRMSVSAQRLYLYDNDPAVPGPPVRTGGPTVSPGIQQLVQNCIEDIQATSVRAPLQNGDIDQQLSGVAINALNARADTGTIKYFTPLEIAINATGKLLVQSMPNLLDYTAQKRIINEDGSYEMIDINKTVYDFDTKQEVVLNDLSQGIYDVTCKAGEAFKNRQDESVQAIQALAQNVPGVGEMSADIVLKNISAPGVDVVAERIRRQMLKNGMIPENQLTDEEREEIQEAQALAQQQPPEPTPEDKIAEAELSRVQAETADVQARAVLKQEELRIKEQKDLLAAQNQAEKLQMEELMLFMKQQAQQSEQQQKALEATLQGQAQVYEVLNMQADTLNKLRDAMGVDAIVGPSNTEAYKQQADMVVEQQEKIST